MFDKTIIPQHPAVSLAFLLQEFEKAGDIGTQYVLINIIMDNAKPCFFHKLDDIKKLFLTIQESSDDIRKYCPTEVIHDLFPEEQEKQDLYTALKNSIDDFVACVKTSINKGHTTSTSTQLPSDITNN